MERPNELDALGERQGVAPPAPRAVPALDSVTQYASLAGNARMTRRATTPIFAPVVPILARAPAAAATAAKASLQLATAVLDRGTRQAQTVKDKSYTAMRDLAIDIALQAGTHVDHARAVLDSGSPDKATIAQIERMSQAMRRFILAVQPGRPDGIDAMRRMLTSDMELRKNAKLPSNPASAGRMGSSASEASLGRTAIKPTITLWKQGAEAIYKRLEAETPSKPVDRAAIVAGVPDVEAHIRYVGTLLEAMPSARRIKYRAEIGAASLPIHKTVLWLERRTGTRTQSLRFRHTTRVVDEVRRLAGLDPLLAKDAPALAGGEEVEAGRETAELKASESKARSALNRLYEKYAAGRRTFEGLAGGKVLAKADDEALIEILLKGLLNQAIDMIGGKLTKAILGKIVAAGAAARDVDWQTRGIEPGGDPKSTPDSFDPLNDLFGDPAKTWATDKVKQPFEKDGAGDDADPNAGSRALLGFVEVLNVFAADRRKAEDDKITDLVRDRKVTAKDLDKIAAGYDAAQTEAARIVAEEAATHWAKANARSITGTVGGEGKETDLDEYMSAFPRHEHKDRKRVEGKSKLDSQALWRRVSGALQASYEVVVTNSATTHKLTALNVQNMPKEIASLVIADAGNKLGGAELVKEISFSVTDARHRIASKGHRRLVVDEQQRVRDGVSGEFGEKFAPIPRLADTAEELWAKIRGEEIPSGLLPSVRPELAPAAGGVSGS